MFKVFLHVCIIFKPVWTQYFFGCQPSTRWSFENVFLHTSLSKNKILAGLHSADGVHGSHPNETMHASLQMMQKLEIPLFEKIHEDTELLLSPLFKPDGIPFSIENTQHNDE